MTVGQHLPLGGDALADLATAVAAAALHLRPTAAEAVHSARAAGLAEAALDDAAWVLLLARGTPAWSALTGRAPDPEATVAEGAADPARRGLLDEHLPTVARHQHAVRARAYRPTSLRPEQAQLLFCAIGTAIREPGHVGVHAKLALQAGASTAELVAACAAAIPVAGYGAWLEASRALDAALAEVSPR